MSQEYKKEIKPAYTVLTVMEEAQRCLLCHDAPCNEACPSGTNPAGFIRSVRFRNFKGAADTVRINNALGAVCARVCPTDRYCQAGCSRTGIDKPIDIGGIQRFITDFEEQTGMTILEKGESKGKKVAIVGSGPAGLQAAASLLVLGYDVDVYDKAEKAGGFMRDAIPEFRLPNHVVDVEVDRIAKLGANFFLGKEVGKDVSMDQLKSDYDAVLVAVGIGKPKMLPMFEGNPIAVPAVTFLAEVSQKEGKVDLPDNALVIGGGDSAMDSATTLKVLGVQNVTCMTRKELADFRASKEELETARECGVTIMDGYAPVEVNGKVVTFKHRKLNSTVTIEADLIVLGVGQEIDAANLGFTSVEGKVEITGYHQTGNVFVTGDMTSDDKDKTVVYAVQKAKEAVMEIDSYLGGGK